MFNIFKRKKEKIEVCKHDWVTVEEGSMTEEEISALLSPGVYPWFHSYQSWYYLCYGDMMSKYFNHFYTNKVCIKCNECQNQKTNVINNIKKLDKTLMDMVKEKEKRLELGKRMWKNCKENQ